MVEPKKLAAIELFEGLPDPALRTIATLCQEMTFAPGQVIFSPELSSRSFYLLEEGRVRLTVHATALPEPLTLSVLETPGQAFGFSTVVGQVHHNTSAEAVTAVRAIAVDGPLFLDYLKTEPAIGFEIMKRVARVISRRLAAVRRLLLETVVDYERPQSNIPEN